MGIRWTSAARRGFGVGMVATEILLPMNPVPPSPGGENGMGVISPRAAIQETEGEASDHRVSAPERPPHPILHQHRLSRGNVGRGTRSLGISGCMAAPGVPLDQAEEVSGKECMGSNCRPAARFFHRSDVHVRH